MLEGMDPQASFRVPDLVAGLILAGLVVIGTAGALADSIGGKWRAGMRIAGLVVGLLLALAAVGVVVFFNYSTPIIGQAGH